MVQGEVASALLHITADSRYRLHLNGRWLGDGPARSFPHLQQFDTYDVTAFLHPAGNVLAVTVNHYGESTFHYNLGRGGLLCQLEITYGDGRTDKIVTDRNWKIAPFAAYQRPAPRISCQMPFEENFDARQFAPDWQQPSFDDHDWQNAVEIGPVGTAPWTALQPRAIPFLSRVPYYPLRIVSIRFVRPARLVETVNIKLSLLPGDRTANHNAYRGLIVAEVISPTRQKAKLVRNYFIHQGHWYINGKEIEPPARRETEIELKQDLEILFDFGQELVGFTEFEVDAAAGAILDFHCFEAINDGVIQETYGNRSSFRYVTRSGLQHFVTDWRRGFRYTAMTVRSLTAPLKIRYLRTLMSTYPAVGRGSFQCSDERLNRIWKVGRHTLLCCMEDTFTDCPTYEQTFWVGDARNEALICHAAYGEWALVERCVRLVPQSLYRSKLPESQVPSGWQNILTAWSLLWIQMAHEYWWLSGDVATLEAVYPGVAQTLRACRELSNNKWGLLSIRAWNMFDWSGADDDHDIVTHNNMFLAEALNRAIDLAKVLKKEADVAEWQSFRQKLVENINKYLWSDELNGYIDSIHNDGTPSRSVSQQTNTLALLYHVAPPYRSSLIAAYTTTPPQGMVCFASPFALFYLLEELAKESRREAILQITRDRWGFMLDAGATTFWETFPGFEKEIPTRSHCHAWSAAPTYFLSRYQLGVAPLEPGFSKALIAPQPVGLSWAMGRVPTPHGEIEVQWQKSDDNFKLKLSLPEGVAGRVELLVDPRAFPDLRADGQPTSRGLSEKIRGVKAEGNRWVKG